MKIAILTQPLHVNFGGTLQAFALQRILKNMNCEVETINYKKKESSDIRKLFSFLKNYIKKTPENYPFFSQEQLIRQQNHMAFIKKQIILSKELNNSKDLRNYLISNNFDTVIVGSDQVWRKSYSPNINDYFFECISDKNQIKKVSYAASFGLDEWEYSLIETENLKVLAKKINHISVRESSAIELISNILDCKSKLVLDPTLCFNKEYYIEFFKLKRKINDNYIFTYILDSNKDKQKIIKKIKDELGGEIFSNQPKKIIREKLLIDDIENYIYPSIEDWICAFYNATFVITDSFHGAVFSIIFNKPFIAIINKERGASRFNSLFNLLGLEERLIYEDNDLDINILSKEIDYAVINLKLEKLRSESIAWLKKSLEDDLI